VTLEVRLLGPLEAVGQHGPVDLGGPRRRSVLAILALTANRVVSIDRLADALYGQDPPATAVAQVQRQVSDLRKALGAAIETRAPGYLLRLEPGALDLERFERLTAAGGAALARGEHAEAAARLREALALWRGDALEDLAAEPFAAAAVARLDDLRLAALERRIEAELALGAHHELVPELEALVREQSAHEGFAAQLMLALYRCRRQQDALAAYRGLRARLVGDYGIEPTPALRALEAAVLRQDDALDAPVAAIAAPLSGAVLACSRSEPRLRSLVALAAPLARAPGRELLLVRLLNEPGELSAGAASVARLRVAAGVPARGAAFVSDDMARDVGRLAEDNAVDLVLLDAPQLSQEPLSGELVALLERCPADVALVAGALSGGDGRVLVAFAGGEHDWAALELSAWLAAATGCDLALAGPNKAGGGDASRALAAASLAVQRSVGIDAAPLLVTADQLAAAADGARAVVCGLPPGWRRGGLGATRGALVRVAPAPVLVVHNGPRPGGLAPADSLTRFTRLGAATAGRRGHPAAEPRRDVLGRDE
jgi:DNA-binding SARP family transcriptional activator